MNKLEKIADNFLEVFDPKSVNSGYIQFGVSSLRLVGLHLAIMVNLFWVLMGFDPIKIMPLQIGFYLVLACTVAL